MTTQRDDLQRLLNEIDRFETAMLVTHGASGELHARPMIISDVGANGDLWFATSRETPKVTELDCDGRAVAILQSDDMFISVSGHIRMVTDHVEIAAHLSRRAKKWLDPDKGSPTALVLGPLSAEIWDCAVNAEVRTAVRQALLRRGGSAAEARAPLVEHVVIPFPPA